MLGRKRVNIDNAQEINLWIPNRYKKSFTTMGDLLDYQLEEADLLLKDENAFNKKYDNNMTEIANMNHLFYHENMKTGTGNWKLNMIGMGRTMLDKNFFREMESEMESDKFAYIKKQLEWLGLENTFDESNLIEEVTLDDEVETLEKYLDNIIDTRLYDEEQQVISYFVIGELTTIAKDIDYRTKRLKPSTLENILREQLELPYVVSKIKREDKMIDGKRTRRNYIVISKIA